MRPPAAAEWLPVIERRIKDSVRAVEIASSDQENVDSIDQAVANSANLFFRIASTQLPAEPYIYASKKGELIAEFRANERALTLIISDGRVASYVIGSDGVPKASFLDLSRASASSIRRELHRVMQQFRV
jgi:hypothetical protein